MAVFARQMLTPTGWAKDVRIEIASGYIVSLEEGVQPKPSDEQHEIVVPGMSNVHSHAFQRAMAGLAEMPGSGKDNFWSWREVMYRFALTFDPGQIEAVASQLYVEMLEAGFTRVGEFHYLHHDKDGGAYGNIAEMSERIAAAAAEAGIGLTLLPVFYAHSQFGGLPPGDGQRRFINDIDSFARLLQAAQLAVSGIDGAKVGIAPHSLRAATGDEISAISRLDFEGPIHIHVAEQTREIEDSIAFSGQRPVEWLINNTEADGGWCFIHATHMTDAETKAMAERGVVAGLCPITEANLGDGFFNAGAFIAAGGAVSIGSDSNVLIGVSDELRQLEYSQRLWHRARNVLASEGRSTGRTLFDLSACGGANALVSETGLEVGKPADFVSLKAAFELGFQGDTVLDSWIFGRGVDVDCVWVHGRKAVSGGRHIYREAIGRRFAATMEQLLARY